MSCVWWKVCFFVFNTFFWSFEFFPCRLRFEKNHLPVVGSQQLWGLACAYGASKTRVWKPKDVDPGPPPWLWLGVPPSIEERSDGSQTIGCCWNFSKIKRCHHFHKKTLNLNLWNTITHHNRDPLHAQVLAQRLCRQPWFAITWVRVGFFEGNGMMSWSFFKWGKSFVSGNGGGLCFHSKTLLTHLCHDSVSTQIVTRLIEQICVCQVAGKAKSLWPVQESQ